MDAVADHYGRVAALEAHGISAIYEDWALGIAENEEVRSLIAHLPRPKQQANLVFAASRSKGAPLAEYGAFREWLLSTWAEVVPVILARSTQTNEAARCATLLPQIAAISGPVALLEVGASAGLCLYPDSYSYRYHSAGTLHKIDPKDGSSSVVLDCDLRGALDVPTGLPDVVWRGGVDLNPIDVTDIDSLNWLEALVWPEHDERRDRLRAAARLVTQDPPLLVAGDLTTEVANLATQVPDDCTLVVFHSGVLAYLSVEDRHRFIDQVSALDAVWLSNEGVTVLPKVAAQVPREIKTHGDFVLAKNGIPVAITAPHGQYYRALQTK